MNSGESWTQSSDPDSSGSHSKGGDFLAMLAVLILYVAVAAVVIGALVMGYNALNDDGSSPNNAPTSQWGDSSG